MHLLVSDYSELRNASDICLPMQALLEVSFKYVICIVNFVGIPNSMKMYNTSFLSHMLMYCLTVPLFFLHYLQNI